LKQVRAYKYPDAFSLSERLGPAISDKNYDQV
jgi:hypothetical protein